MRALRHDHLGRVRQRAGGLACLLGGAQPHDDALRAAGGDVPGAVGRAEERERPVDQLVFEAPEALEDEALPEAVGREIHAVRVRQQARVLVAGVVDEAEETAVAPADVVLAGVGEHAKDLVAGDRALGEVHGAS
jgi:hypothetical protein